MAKKNKKTQVEVMNADSVRGRFPILSQRDSETLDRAELDGMRVAAEILYTPFGNFLISLSCIA